MRVSAPRSSSEEEPLTRRDNEAIWVEVGLPTRVFKAWADSWSLLADGFGESTDRWIEELSELEEDELLDGVRTAELLGFSESKYSEDTEGNKWKAERSMEKEKNCEKEQWMNSNDHKVV